MLHAFNAWQEHKLRPLRTAAEGDNVQLPQVLLIQLPNGGLGNRMPALVTGVLMAAVTNRVLMLDPRPNFSEYISLALDTNWERYGQFFGGAGRCRVDNMRMASDPLLDWCGNNATSTMPVVEYESWDYDGPLLQINALLAPHLAALFPAGNLFHHVSKWLFKPTKEVADAMAPYAALAGQCLVGMHMRCKKPYPMQGREAPKEPPLELFSGVARAIAQHAEGNVFLAADANVFVQMATHMPGRQVWWTSMTQTSVESNLAVGANPGTDLSAVVDMLLLARCRHLVITSGSTFGFVAAALADVKPTVVVPYDHPHPYDQPWFWTSVSSEPCMYAASEKGLEGMPAEVAAALKAAHPLFLFHNQCHP